MTTEEVMKLIQMCAAQISEHTGHSVQIMTCFSANGQITPIFGGLGSWFERKGLVHEFLESDKDHSLAHEISEVINPDPPEEDWQKA